MNRAYKVGRIGAIAAVVCPFLLFGLLAFANINGTLIGWAQLLGHAFIIGWFLGMVVAVVCGFLITRSHRVASSVYIWAAFASFLLLLASLMGVQT